MHHHHHLILYNTKDQPANDFYVKLPHDLNLTTMTDQQQRWSVSLVRFIIQYKNKTPFDESPAILIRCSLCEFDYFYGSLLDIIRVKDNHFFPSYPLKRVAVNEIVNSIHIELLQENGHFIVTDNIDKVIVVVELTK